MTYSVTCWLNGPKITVYLRFDYYNKLLTNVLFVSNSIYIYIFLGHDEYLNARCQ